MSRLIIICGLPGSGKTTLAKKLSERLKVACIHKDTIKEALYSGLGLTTLEDSKKIGKPSVEIMLAIAAQQIENGVDVIIESPFNFSDDYELFEKWQEAYDLIVYSIICSIDGKERERRFLTRSRHEAHHDQARVLSGQDFSYSGIPGIQIRVSTDLPVNILVDSIISQIK